MKLAFENFMDIKFYSENFLKDASYFISSRLFFSRPTFLCKCFTEQIFNVKGEFPYYKTLDM